MKLRVTSFPHRAPIVARMAEQNLRAGERYIESVIEELFQFHKSGVFQLQVRRLQLVGQRRVTEIQNKYMSASEEKIGLY